MAYLRLQYVLRDASSLKDVVRLDCITDALTPMSNLSSYNYRFLLSRRQKIKSKPFDEFQML